MAYKDYTVQSWTNIPQYETMEYENEEGETVSEEVEISPITYNMDKTFYTIGEAIAHYDTIDLSAGGAIIFYRLTIAEGNKTFRHSFSPFEAAQEEKILKDIEERQQ